MPPKKKKKISRTHTHTRRNTHTKIRKLAARSRETAQWLRSSLARVRTANEQPALRCNCERTKVHSPFSPSCGARPYGTYAASPLAKAILFLESARTAAAAPTATAAEAHRCACASLCVGKRASSAKLHTLSLSLPLSVFYANGRLVSVTFAF